MKNSRQSVLFFCKTGPFIEISLHCEDFFPVFRNIIGSEVEAVEGIQQINKRLKCFRLIEYRQKQ